jgi:phosphatidylserine decarboxylase precursor
MVAFAKEHGEYMDSSESAEELKRFTRDASYRIDDYYVGASGWLTFNQFFTRSVKPGRRPVAEPCNERVIVSPTDSVYLGCWPVHERGSVLIKGVEYSIDDLLAGSPYKHAFAGGLFAHCYLDSADYHRFHVPVGGRILESRVISGNVLVNVRRKADGSLEAIDDVGFQFRQTRGVFVIESALGPVAVLPIGMGHVSSVNLTAEVGVILRKGDEFGFFAYGGSDIILLFAAGRAVLTATPGRHYLQGERIGEEGR